MRHQLATPESKCAEVSAQQHGVITYAQLARAGLSKGAIDRRVRAGRLHRVHRGVYAWGHSGLSDEGRWMAAVLACGDGAVLSHRSAAEHWEMLAGRSAPIHVTVVGDGGRRRNGLMIHRSSSLTDASRTCRNGIAVTTTARTIADLRRTEPRGIVARAIRYASYKGWDIGEETEHSGERGELERRFLRFCHRNHLAQPVVNVPVGPYTVDFLWRAARLVVETDDWHGHRGRQAFEDDRARDAYLRRSAYEVLRFTWRQLEDDPTTVLSLLRRYLRPVAVP